MKVVRIWKEAVVSFQGTVPIFIREDTGENNKNLRIAGRGSMLGPPDIGRMQYRNGNAPNE
jgi:hypothetical protein